MITVTNFWGLPCGTTSAILSLSAALPILGASDTHHCGFLYLPCGKGSLPVLHARRPLGHLIDIRMVRKLSDAVRIERVSELDWLHINVRNRGLFLIACLSATARRKSRQHHSRTRHLQGHSHLGLRGCSCNCRRNRCFLV
ncbi:exported hypothetical protein [Vibrio coralliirubri]|nr:exported hypothetical protein [Vibrio coralliirubri]